MKEATYEEAQARLRIIEQQKREAEEKYSAMHKYLSAQAVKKSECAIKIVPQGTNVPDPIFVSAEDAAKVMELIMSLTQKVAFT